MTETSEQTLHTCAKCGSQTEEQQAVINGYCCLQCNYELAHLDTAANGAIRGVFGWLKEIGAKIGGRYQVETVLGKGGFGATYLVLDDRVQGKRWALKEIPEMLFDEFEVSLLSQLDHPSIPIIVDRFTDGGMVYLVLKFGGTKTLATECKKLQKISYPALKPWILQIADVLEYLHSRTPPIIHRDLKPENILIDDQNRVMLIDFGIAKESVDAAVTRTLGRAASHGFSPPEQVMGTGTDVRSDIYSFAATIYFALTGQTPVAAHERVAGAELHPAGEMVEGIPAEVDAMLMKALSLNINGRPKSIAEFLPAFTGLSSAENDAMQAGKTVQISDIQFGPVMNETLAKSTPLGGQSQESVQQNGNMARLVGIMAAVVAFSALSAGGVYWFMNRKTDDTPEKVVSEQPAVVTETVALPATNTQAATAGAPSTMPTTPATSTASQGTTIAPTTMATTAPSSAVAPATMQPDSNAPSALDILNKRRENQKSVETDVVDAPPEPSAEEKLKAEAAAKAAKLAAAEKERKAKAKRLAAERARRAKLAAAKKTKTQKKTTTTTKKKPNWGNQQKGNF